MQRPVPRGNAWRITVRYNGKRYTATRDTSRECEQWAARKLLELKAQAPEPDQDTKTHFSFKALFQLYYEEVGSKMRSARFIKQQLDSFNTYWGELANESIHDLTPLLVKQWRDERLKKVSPATVLRQLNLYSAIFEHARIELFLIKDNVFRSVGRPESTESRNRRVLPNEIDLVLQAMSYAPGTTPRRQSHYIGWAFLFALETAMRKGEILSIVRSNIFDDYIRLPMTKNGTARDVPLTQRAKELLTLITHTNEQLVPHNSNSFRILWQRNIRKVGLNGDLHFHDTRHEAITRFVNERKLPVEILAKVTGHKDIKTLINTYYNPTASDIAKMMNAA